MGERTGIPYVHHTRNFWAGCTKVGPGCDGCYAEAFNRWTQGKNEATGEAKNWGPGAKRVAYLKGATESCAIWDAKAKAAGERRRVFINTFSDTFDNEAPPGGREAVFTTIRDCPSLDFLLVTKRIGNVADMVPQRWVVEEFPANVRILITVVNQEEYDRDVVKLLALNCKNGISYEPALGPIAFYRARIGSYHRKLGLNPDHDQFNPLSPRLRRRVEWIIGGGESDQAGHKTRACNLDWFRAGIEHCKENGVPWYTKQLGSRPFDPLEPDRHGEAHPDGPEHDPSCYLSLVNKAGEDPEEWAEEFRVREYPT